ncbi:hypothetical protein AB0I22_10990 [Streptomyces sp. NPDC050610]|uniref:hypothetical protein n=1 Tax=Streptomyces sp. NPDC050610 TaxID=3157097 RepID=UPI00342C011A
MTTLLEQRYRTVLRLLPAYYRAEREEEMVETYLHGIDENDQDEMRPAWGEVASVAALAVRSRMGGAGAPARYAAAGSAVRLFALLSVVLHAASELTERAMSLAWFHAAASADRDIYLDPFTHHGAFENVRAAALWLLPLLWAAAYAALVRDRRAAASACAAVAALPSLMFVVDWATGRALGPVSALSVTAAAFAWLTVLALCCGFHSDAPPARLPLGTPGLVLLGTCVLMGAASVAWRDGADVVWGDGWAFTAAAVAWLIAALRTPKRGTGPAADPALPLALAGLGLAVLAVRACMLALWADSNAPGTLMLGIGAQAAVLVLLVAALAVAGTRGLAARTRTD